MSKFIIGTNRPERKRAGEANQLPLFASSIDDAIAQDNEIRLIDLFVDTLKLPDFGFAFEFVENCAHHSTHVGLIFTAYNLRRIFNLVDQNSPKQYLRVLASFLQLLIALFTPFSCIKIFAINYRRSYKTSFLCTINQLYLPNS
jgi:hypothetical protein